MTNQIAGLGSRDCFRKKYEIRLQWLPISNESIAYSLLATGQTASNRHFYFPPRATSYSLNHLGLPGQSRNPPTQPSLNISATNN